MTRETKIGLLVGLAFIIVIGILLSDHFSTATQPPQSLVAPTENVLESARTPGASRQLPPLLPEIEPNRPIQIEADRNTHAQSSDSIFVGPGIATQQGSRSVEMLEQQSQQQSLNTFAPPAAERNLFAQGQGMPPIVQIPPGSNVPSMQVIPGPPVQGANTNTPRGQEPELVPAPDRQPFSGPVREYAAQENDTVSKMALKFLGSKSKANMDLIIKANPSLMANPHKIVIGRKYNIPVPAAAAQPASSGAVGNAAGNATANWGGNSSGEIPGTVAVPFVLPQSPGTLPAAGAAAGAAANGMEIDYTTRTGDTLWSIARDECGSASPAMLKQIFEMNRGVLKSKDKVPSNVVLKLPAKAVASAGN